MRFTNQTDTEFQQLFEVRSLQRLLVLAVLRRASDQLGHDSIHFGSQTIMDCVQRLLGVWREKPHPFFMGQAYIKWKK